MKPEEINRELEAGATRQDETHNQPSILNKSEGNKTLVKLNINEELIGYNPLLGLIVVRMSDYHLKYYNPKYFKVVPSETPKELKQILPTVKEELKQVSTINTLVTKVMSINNQIEKARTTGDEDKFILLGRQINKNKTLINKYLNQLKQDNRFKAEYSNSCLTLQYTGIYAQVKRTVYATIPDGVSI